MHKKLVRLFIADSGAPRRFLLSYSSHIQHQKDVSKYWKMATAPSDAMTQRTR